jgi:hypothetical protein
MTRTFPAHVLMKPSIVTVAPVSPVR